MNEKVIIKKADAPETPVSEPETLSNSFSNMTMADFINLPADEKEIAKRELLRLLRSDHESSNSNKSESPVDSDIEFVAKSVIPIETKDDDGKKTKSIATITTTVDPKSVFKEVVPVTNDTVPAINDTVPAINEAVPSINDAVPTEPEIVRDIVNTKPTIEEITPLETADCINAKSTVEVKVQKEKDEKEDDSDDYEDDYEDEETDDDDIEVFYEESDSDDDDELLEEDIRIMSDYIENIELEDGEDLNDLLAWSAMQEGNLEIELLSDDEEEGREVYDYASLDKVPNERELNDFEEEEAAILRPNKKTYPIEQKANKKTNYKSNLNDTVVDPEIFGQTLKAALADVPPGLRPGLRRWYEKNQRKEARLKKKEETKARKRETKKKNKGKENEESEEGFETQMARIDE